MRKQCFPGCSLPAPQSSQRVRAQLAGTNIPVHRASRMGVDTGLLIVIFISLTYLFLLLSVFHYVSTVEGCSTYFDNMTVGSAASPITRPSTKLSTQNIRLQSENLVSNK